MAESNGSFKNICFVNTSGRKKQLYIKGIPLPFLPSWLLIKIFNAPFGVVVFQRFKAVTRVSFEAGLELIREGWVDKLFVSGRYEGHLEAPNITEEHFLKRGIPREMVCADGLSLDTTGNVKQFLFYLRKHYPGQSKFNVFVVDAFYRMTRTVRTLKKLAKESGIEINIVENAIRPPLTWKNLETDYFLDALLEWAKRFLEMFNLRRFFLERWRRTDKKF